MCDFLYISFFSPVWKCYINIITGGRDEYIPPSEHHRTIDISLLCHRSFGRCRYRSTEASAKTYVNNDMGLGVNSVRKTINYEHM